LAFLCGKICLESPHGGNFLPRGILVLFSPSYGCLSQL
jgi:hypothetical protein